MKKLISAKQATQQLNRQLPSYYASPTYRQRLVIERLAYIIKRDPKTVDIVKNNLPVMLERVVFTARERCFRRGHHTFQRGRCRCCGKKENLTNKE